jgi:outer membrane lipopolysaccharide assembly protein LptE/RlpB
MKKTSLLCFAIIFSISMLGQNTANLKMNLEKNKVYRLKSVSEQTVTQTMNGVQQTTESKINYTFSMKMIDATADFIITEVHFDTLMTNTNTMGKEASYSSVNEWDIKSTETADVISCIMNRLSKNALYVKLDFTGKPLEIINLKLLSDLVLKDTSSITLTGQTAEAVKKQIVNSVSDSDLKTMIELFTWSLPDKQVSAGDEWVITQQISSGGMMLDIITTYHLDGIYGNNANITAESDIKTAANAVPIQSGGATVTYDDIKGLSKSDMVIDIRTGLIVETSGKTHITGNLGISAPGFSMQMPMDINGESKVIAL